MRGRVDEVWARRSDDTVPAVPSVMGSPPSRSMHPIPAGTLLGGQYRVLDGLGRGAMGVVVLASDERLDRLVAIKIMLPQYAADPRSRKRLLAEARAMARIRHRHVIEIHAFGELQGAPFLVMEYVPGTTLDRIIGQRAEPLGVDEGINLLEQLCRGVAAMHASGIVHRDLKPSNVLVDPWSRVVVADLGVARPLDPEPPEPFQEDTSTSGTPAYMAPERLAPSGTHPRLRTRGDVYSLGVIACQVLTGQLPYSGPVGLGVGELRPLRRLNPLLLPAFEPVLAAAVNEDPTVRTPNPLAFRAQLLEAAHLAWNHHRNLRIAVADVDKAHRDLMCMALARAFPRAAVAGHGRGDEAAAAVIREQTDLLVLDGTTESELTVALDLLQRTGSPRPKVLVVGSSVRNSGFSELTDRGVNGFVDKPIEPTRLVCQARVLLSGAR